jgi:ATP-dependent Clp protease ATP-binding subunit ClpX
MTTPTAQAQRPSPSRRKRRATLTKLFDALDLFALRSYQPCLLRCSQLPHLPPEEVARFEFWCLMSLRAGDVGALQEALRLKVSYEGLDAHVLSIQDSLTGLLLEADKDQAYLQVTANSAQAHLTILRLLISQWSDARRLEADEDYRQPVFEQVHDLRIPSDVSYLAKALTDRLPLTLAEPIAAEPLIALFERYAGSIMRCPHFGLLIEHLRQIQQVPWSAEIIAVALNHLATDEMPAEQLAGFITALPRIPVTHRARVVQVVLAVVARRLFTLQVQGLEQTLTDGQRWTDTMTLVRGRLVRHERTAAPVRTPAALIADVDRSVIGMTAAKRLLATRFHLQARALQKDGIQAGGVILLAGPTGSGKTMLLRALADAAGLPFADVNAAAMVPEGIVGVRVQDLGRKLLRTSSGFAERAQVGVVFLDEFDKLAESHYSTEVLLQLLTLMSGGQFDFHSSKEGDLDGRSLSAKRILWVLGGTFSRLVETQATEITRIGFDTSEQSPRLVTHEALVDAGLPREVVGRIEQVVTVPALTTADLERILVESSASPLLRFQATLTTCGAQVTLDDGVVPSIAATAMRMGLGARGLSAIVGPLFEPHLFAAANGDGYQGHITCADVERLAA